MNEFKGLEVPKMFKVGGFTHYLLKFGVQWAVYESKNELGCVVGYELHKLRIRPPCTAFGKEYGEAVRLAGNEEFGKWAWSFSTKESALKEFNKLIENEIKE